MADRWSRGEIAANAKNFHKLVGDTIIQDDNAVAISNMRTAIKDTNVVLNMVISPGIILVPSNMFILKKKLAGYNNTLTLATADMKFGVNKKINYKAPVAPVLRIGRRKAQPPPHAVTITGRVSTHYEELGYLLGSTMLTGIMIARYII